MIKKLKLKIILMTMTVIGLVLFAAGITYSAYSINGVKNETYQILDSSIAEYVGPDVPPPTNLPAEIGKGEGRRTLKFDICTVKYDKSSDETTILSSDAYIEEEVLKKAISEALKERRKDGEISSVKLIYVMSEAPDTTYFAFADSGYLSGEVSNIILTSVLIFGSVFIVIFVLSIFLANVTVKPVKNAMEEQKRFIADASHELKTPLAVISANTKILQNDKTNDQAKKDEWLKSTEEEIAHMNSIIVDMLTLAQGESLREIEKKQFDLSRTTTQICLQFDAVAYDKNVSLEYNIDDEVEYLGNEKMIKQLLMIFIDNAVKYEPENGKVFVKLYKTKNKPTISVKNFNSNISEEDLPHVFERFYRADKSRTSEGVGLGLAIAKNIAELHGGSVRVFSSKDSGTEFKISL